MEEPRPPYKPPVPFVKRGLLFLPTTFRPQPQQSPLGDHFAALYIGQRDVFGKESTLAEIHQLTSAMNWKNAVFGLSRIGLVLHNEEGADDDIQSKLLDGLFNRASAARIKNVAEKDGMPVKFFHKQQILFLMKQALLRSRDITVPDERMEMEHLMRAMLQVSDVLDHDFMMKAKSGAVEDGNVLIWGLRNSLLNSVEEIILRYTRHHQLHFVLSKPHLWEGISDYVDLRELFLEATGTPLDEFAAVGVSLIATYNNYRFTNTIPHDEKSFFINEKTHLGKSTIGAAAIERIMGQLARTRDEFRSELEKEEALVADDTYSFLTFRRYPLLRLEEGVLICLAPQFLEERITSGVYWTIFDYLKKVGDEERLNRFMRFFGQLFERYAYDVCLRMLGGDANRVNREITYSSPQGERKSSDVAIIYPRTLLLIEVVNTKINMLRTVIKGDYASYERDSKNIIIYKAKQLSRTISDFKAGNFSISGHSARDFDTYIPVVVTNQTFPQHYFAWSHIEEELKRQSILNESDILPLSILDAEELELAEAAVQEGKSFAELLRQKDADPNFRVMPFKNYLVATHEDGITPNKAMADNFLQIMKGMHGLLFDKSGEKTEG